LSIVRLQLLHPARVRLGRGTAVRREDQDEDAAILEGREAIGPAVDALEALEDRRQRAGLQGHPVRLVGFEDRQRRGLDRDHGGQAALARNRSGNWALRPSCSASARTRISLKMSSNALMS